MTMICEGYNPWLWYVDRGYKPRYDVWIKPNKDINQDNDQFQPYQTIPENNPLSTSYCTYYDMYVSWLVNY